MHNRVYGSIRLVDRSGVECRWNRSHSLLNDAMSQYLRIGCCTDTERVRQREACLLTNDLWLSLLSRLRLVFASNVM
jgi:hypothetical protein